MFCHQILLLMVLEYLKSYFKTKDLKTDPLLELEPDPAACYALGK